MQNEILTTTEIAEIEREITDCERLMYGRAIVGQMLATIRAYQEVMPPAYILRDVAQFMILNGGCVSEIDDLLDWADRIEALEMQMKGEDEQT